MVVKGPTLWDVRVPMRDGVELSADVHLPPEGVNGGPYPVLLERNCYNNQMSQEGFIWLTQHGYAVVLQDVRGRNDSDGDFYPIHQEHVDGYDSVEWLAKQPWCTGKVGSVGGSYMGWTQWATARERPPSLKAMWTAVEAGRFGRQEIWNNGSMLLITLGWHNLTGGHAFHYADRVDWRSVYWHLPLRTMDVEALGRKLPAWADWCDHPGIDDFWKEALLNDDDFSKMDVPAIHAGGFWDYNRGATTFFYEGMRNSLARDHQYLILGPWLHGTVGMSRQIGEIDFGEQAIAPNGPLMLRWFDYWLKGEDNGVIEELDTRRARVFVTGANEWRDEPEWPLPSAPHSLFLHSAGDAGANNGTLDTTAPADEPPDAYTYDPADPVIAMPGDWNAYAFTPLGLGPSVDSEELAVEPFDQRPDILMYTSAPLDAPVTAVGVPWMVLYASSDGPDTDWHVTLEDMYPDGRILPLANGQLCARFRESLEYETFMEPGEIYEFRFELLPISHRFDNGHRVRMRVTSSMFPRSSRNLNTDEPLGSATTIRVARNTIFHDAEHPSRLELPGVAS